IQAPPACCFSFFNSLASGPFVSVLNDRRPFALYSLILGGFLFLSFISRFSSPLGGCFSWFFCSMGFLTITFQVSWPLHKTAALLTGANTGRRKWKR
ncbi:hypothetical protein T310_9926, partial [Rasamsonia emersonii CBS 393.64]